MLMNFPQRLLPLQSNLKWVEKIDWKMYFCVSNYSFIKYLLQQQKHRKLHENTIWSKKNRCVVAQLSQLVCLFVFFYLLRKFSVSPFVSFPCCLCATVCRKQQQSVQHRQADGADDERPQGSGQRDQQLPRVGSGGVQQ